MLILMLSAEGKLVTEAWLFSWQNRRCVQVLFIVIFQVQILIRAYIAVIGSFTAYITFLQKVSIILIA